MNSLIPNLFIITTELSIVLAIVIGIMIFFYRKAKQTDQNSVNQLVEDILDNQDFRVKLLTTNLQNNNYSGDCITKAKDLHELEKGFLQEFLNIYLKRDVYRLDNIPSALIELTDEFLIPNNAEKSDSQNESVDGSNNNEVELTLDESQILEEARAIKEEHLKEINALRLKNTELNEHLFEALETITGLVTEHSKSTGANDKPSAQQLLDAILYLKDHREKVSNTAAPAPKQEITPEVKEVAVVQEEIEDNEPEDETLFSETVPDLGITDILNTDLESDLNQADNEETIAKDETIDEDNTIVGESDPWADALAEQHEVEAKMSIGATEEAEDTSNNDEDDDPWADALAEQSEAKTETASEPEQAEPEKAESSEDDPWADALAEQSEGESAQTTSEDDPWADALAEQSEGEAAQATSEDDPWADALAEQSEAEAAQATSEDDGEEVDPWADALAEQSAAESEPSSQEEDDDPWASALAEQSEAEASQTETEEDPWADALAEQSAGEVNQAEDEDDDPWAAALAEQKEVEDKG
ncbi:MAG: hypothetical protein HQL46_11880 [Gammaproteobacteria bacterium]|nr:hypothetical protein [Gammaproteobacteria bacterium]